MNCGYCTIPGDKRGLPNNPLDVESFMEMVGGLKERVQFIFSGGEPFLVPNLIDLLIKLTDKNYDVTVLSNLIPASIKRLAEIKNKDCVRICSSIHYLEYERTGAKNIFVDNYHYLRDNNFENIWPKLVADTKMTPYDIQAFKDFYIDQNNVKGIFVIPLLVNTLKDESYIDTYSGEQEKLFWSSTEEKDRMWAYIHGVVEKYKGKPCKAGRKIVYIDSKGDVSPCVPLMIDSTDEYKIGNIKDGFAFNDNDIICPLDECLCFVDPSWGF